MFWFTHMLTAICTQNQTWTSRARKLHLEESSCLDYKYQSRPHLCKFWVSHQVSLLCQEVILRVWPFLFWILVPISSHVWAFISLQSEISKTVSLPVLTSWEVLSYHDICSFNKYLLSKCFPLCHFLGKVAVALMDIASTSTATALECCYKC